MSAHPPASLFLRVFGALLGLTALTVAAAYFDFGAINTVLMLTIAVAKGTLVVLYFMHVRWSDKLVWVFAASGFLWLVILMAITFADVVSRDWIPLEAL
jgi:cytochrome c oxidase subunit 4